MNEGARARDGSLPEKHRGFKLYKRCLRYFLPYRVHIFFAAVFTTAAGLCDACTAWLVKPALDELFVNKNTDLLLIIPLAFVGVTFLKAVMKLLQNYLMHYAGLRVLEVLRDELCNKIIMLPVGFFESSRTGVIMSHIMNDVASIRASMPAGVMIVRQIITLISLACVVFYRDYELALWSVVVLPLVFWPFVHFGRRIRKLTRKSMEQTGELTSQLQEVLSGIKVVKAFGAEEREKMRFDRENRRLMDFTLKGSLTGELASCCMEIIAAAGISLVILVGGMQVIDGRQSPGTFFSFITALILMYEPVKKFSSANLAVQMAVAGAERVFGLLDNPALCVEKGGGTAFTHPFRELRFENVVFSYPDGTRALNGISFSVKAGEKIALVGPSGAGKSTVANLIPRFYDPQEGRVTLNGADLRDYDLYSLRSGISSVSQDAFLFNVSVRENIIYGMEETDDENIGAAAKAAYAGEFIAAMPQGFDTLIGERGVKISGGQKQRLTIARALIKNAPLLILDEATSALDSESERLVRNALDNLMADRTSIAIAHRLSTVMDADRILVLEKGSIIAQGTHEELLHTSPLYAKLYEMQFNTETDGGDPVREADIEKTRDTCNHAPV
ncbi:MAG: ABC transporter ATP-binding protein/permease [Desulfovibrio sp.]|jgi:subfamily B ATP-binding cassette protein MsbA|nr:ABC transporter ATP-binding protein/permease [Desulfovibrio sp.]